MNWAGRRVSAFINARRRVCLPAWHARDSRRRRIFNKTRLKGERNRELATLDGDALALHGGCARNKCYRVCVVDDGCAFFLGNSSLGVVVFESLIDSVIHCVDW